MTRFEWAVMISLALCSSAAAQPAPDTQPAPAPAPDTQPPPEETAPTTSVPGTPAAGTQSPTGEEAPPSDGTVPPTDGAAPIPTESPPPPPPPPPQPAVLRTPGLLASSATDQHLSTHSYALDHETTLPDHQFSGSLFADYWFTSGPRIGGTFGMFRSFEAVLGVLRDTETTGGGMTGQPEMSAGKTRIMYGGNIGFLSIMGVQLSGGLMFFSGSGDTAAVTPCGQLSIPLDAHWLPFHIENTRVRATYPFGLGIEWGAL